MHGFLQQKERIKSLGCKHCKVVLVVEWTGEEEDIHTEGQAGVEYGEVEPRWQSIHVAHGHL